MNLTEAELAALAKRTLQGETIEERAYAASFLLAQAIAYRRIAEAERARADKRSPFTVLDGGNTDAR